MDERPDRSDVRLYLLRHADAGDPAAWEGDDADRPLSEKGRRQAAAMARFLAARRLIVDAIVSSPKVRARETASPVGEALGLEVTLDERLAGRMDLDTLAGLIDGLSGRRIMLVGHDPDFSELLSALSGAGYVPLRKGALARIDVALPLQFAGGILRWLLPPDLVIEGD